MTPTRPARRAHPWRPDVTICFDGVITGYGSLARRLVEVERLLTAMAVTSEFRCRRAGWRLRLAGLLPLSARRELRDLLRVGRALGMPAAATVRLPDHATGQAAFTAVAVAGAISTLELDLTGLTAATAPGHRAAVRSWVDVAASLGMDVEVRGEMPVVRGSGVLRQPWLDRTGFTVAPAAADRPTGPPDALYVGLDGTVHADERAFRTARAPIGSLHGPAEEVETVLRRIIAAAGATAVGTPMTPVPTLVHEFGGDLPRGAGPDAATVSAPTPVAFRGVPLHSRKVEGHAGGRAVGATDLLERIRPALRAAGVTRLADITGLDDLGVPVTLAIRPNGATLSNSAGKGLSRDAALASGAMEAIELHHAEEWAPATERMTYAEAFRDLDAPPPDRLPLTAHGLFRHDLTLDWVRGWDLAGGTEIGLPVAMVRMGDRRCRLDTLHAFQITSNGLASSTTLVEAVHAGLLEAVERDAVTCWRYRRSMLGASPPAVATEAFGSDVVDDLVERLARRGAQVFVQDNTVDTAVPVYSAYLFSARGAGRGVHMGFGADLDPVAAVLRAITEACQSRAVHIAGSRDDVFRHRIAEVAGTEEEIEALERMLGDADPEPVAGPETGATFEYDVELVLARLAAVGLDQVVVVDLSPPGLPVAVAKVVVPGMEGYLTEGHTPGSRARLLAGEVET